MPPKGPSCALLPFRGAAFVPVLFESADLTSLAPARSIRPGLLDPFTAYLVVTEAVCCDGNRNIELVVVRREALNEQRRHVEILGRSMLMDGLGCYRILSNENN